MLPILSKKTYPNSRLILQEIIISRVLDNLKVSLSHGQSQLGLGPNIWTELNKNEIVVVSKSRQREARVVYEEIEPKCGLKTIITNDWEVFDEDLVKMDGDDGEDKGRTIEEDRLALMPLIEFDNVHDPFGNHQELPDLIRFL